MFCRYLECWTNLNIDLIIVLHEVRWSPEFLQFFLSSTMYAPKFHGSPSNTYISFWTKVVRMTRDIAILTAALLVLLIKYLVFHWDSGAKFTWPPRANPLIIQISYIIASFCPTVTNAGVTSPYCSNTWSRIHGSATTFNSAHELIWNTNVHLWWLTLQAKYKNSFLLTRDWMFVRTFCCKSVIGDMK